MSSIDLFRQRVITAKSKKIPEIRISLDDANNLIREIDELINKPPNIEVIEVERVSPYSGVDLDGGRF